jgi:hypothetical protein
MTRLKLSFAGWIYPAMLLCVMAMTTGCAITGENQSVNGGDRLLREAQEALKSGAKVRAQELFEAASKTNPADKTPWINLAQLHFDEGNYAQAVTAGQEVLARDAKDQVAQSIVLVSSLRLASKSLAEMRELNQWTGDARMEAKKIASILRENLKEEVLVPDISLGDGKIKSGNETDVEKAVAVKRNPRPKSSAAPSPAKRGVVRGSSPPAAAAPSPSSSAGSSAGGRSDPFGSLR